MRKKKLNPLDVKVMVRFTTAESAEIAALADSAGLSNAEYIRDIVRAHMKRNRYKLLMPQGG